MLSFIMEFLIGIIKEQREKGMKKKGLLLLLVSVVLTGCQPDISSIIGEVTDEETAVEEDDVANVENATGDNSAGESASVYSTAEDDKSDVVYEELISKITEGVEKNDLNLREFDLSEKTDLQCTYDYGYLIKDLDDDGTKELILGKNSYIEGTKVPYGSYDSVIYDIFTVKYGKPVHVLKAGADGDEVYLFGADDKIVREQRDYDVDSPISIVGIIYKFAGDKLVMVDGIRCEYDEESQGDKFYYTTQDPYEDRSNEISVDEIEEIIDKNFKKFVEFTKFVETPKPEKKVTVYTAPSCSGYMYSEWRRWVDLEKKYIKLNDDNTGELNLHCNGDGGYYRFKYDDKKMYVVGWLNDPEDTLIGEGIEYEYKIEGNTLKLKNDYGDWETFEKEQN